MDKVQWYLLCYMGLTMFLSGLMNGERNNTTHHWYDFIISWIITAPIIGRVFGWW